MILPNGLFVDIASSCLSVNLIDVLHLEPLFECFELFKVFLLQHLPDQEPVQVVVLHAQRGSGLVQQL